MRKFIFVLLVTLIYSNTIAQKFEIQSVNFDAGIVNIKFKVIPQYLYEKYNITLYGSHDGYQNELTYVTGVGEIEAEKRDNIYSLTWDAKKELTKFDGDIQFEIRGRVTYVPLHADFTNLKAKHKKVTPLSWSGGNANDGIVIRLEKEGQNSRTINSFDNNAGQYNWMVTKDIPKDKGYILVIENSSNPKERFQSPPFQIKGKSAFGAVFIPTLLIGGGAAYWFLKPLPDPPKPKG